MDVAAAVIVALARRRWSDRHRAERCNCTDWLAHVCVGPGESEACGCRCHGDAAAPPGGQGETR